MEFVATATRKAEEEGLLEAAGNSTSASSPSTGDAARPRGPTPSKSKELIGWPGVSEASAIAGGAKQELVLEKRSYENEVTVAIGR